MVEANRRIIHDISRVLSQDLKPYAGDPSTVFETWHSLNAGDDFTLTRLCMGLHTGTHLDLPAHFISGGMTADRYPLCQAILPAVLVTSPGPKVDEEVVELAGPLDGIALLVRTECLDPRSSRDPSTKPNHNEGPEPSGKKSLDDKGVDESAIPGYITREASIRLERSGVGLVGIDSPSVDREGDTRYPVHRTLLGKGIPLLENADFRQVRDGRYILICLPLSLLGCEASPIRAVLVNVAEGPDN